MSAHGIDWTPHRSKSTTEVAGLDFAAVVMTGCGDAEFRTNRNGIERQLKELRAVL